MAFIGNTINRLMLASQGNIRNSGKTTFRLGPNWQGLPNSLIQTEGLDQRGAGMRLPQSGPKSLRQRQIALADGSKKLRRRLDNIATVLNRNADNDPIMSEVQILNGF